MHCPLLQVLPLGQPQTPLVQQPPLGHCAAGTHVPPLQQVPVCVQGRCASQVVVHCPFTGGWPVLAQTHWPT